MMDIVRDLIPGRIQEEIVLDRRACVAALGLCIQRCPHRSLSNKVIPRSQYGRDRADSGVILVVPDARVVPVVIDREETFRPLQPAVDAPRGFRPVRHGLSEVKEDGRDPPSVGLIPGQDVQNAHPLHRIGQGPKPKRIHELTGQVDPLLPVRGVVVGIGLFLPQRTRDPDRIRGREHLERIQEMVPAAPDAVRQVRPPGEPTPVTRGTGNRMPVDHHPCVARDAVAARNQP